MTKRILNATAVPFVLTADQALSSFKKWSDHPFSPHKSQTPSSLKIFKVFIPFWFYDAAVQSEYIARVGYRHKTVEFSHSHNKYIDNFKYRYRVLHAEHFSKHESGNQWMRQYSSDKLSPELTQRLTEQSLPLQSELNFDEKFISSSDALIEQIKARPSTLWPEVLNQIDAQERIKAAKEIKNRFEADKVEITQLTLKIIARTARAVYLPSFIVQYDSNGLTNLKAVISGIGPAKITAIKNFSPLKVGTATLIFNGLALLAISSLTKLSVFSAVLFSFTPAAFAAWMSLLIPKRILAKQRRNSKKWREKLLQFELQQNDRCDSLKNEEKEFEFEDAESFSYYSNLFNQKAQQHTRRVENHIRREEQRLLQKDHKGYYRLLGLKPAPNITSADVRLAFKAKAHQLHPDRANEKDGLEEKRSRNALFKRVLDAYKVLHDDEKRRQYDAEGTSQHDGNTFI